jgi:hypothetical protein
MATSGIVWEPEARATTFPTSSGPSCGFFDFQLKGVRLRGGNEGEPLVRLNGRLTVVLLVLASFVVSGSIAVAEELPPGGSFIDDDGNIHEGNIEAIAVEGITKGCNPPTNDRYCPDRSVTRGQMAAFLSRALELSGTSTEFFTDVGDSVFEADINKLAAAGITRGCNPPKNDRYCPDAKVTRGQMAAFLVRGFGYTDAGDGDLFIDDDTSIFEADIDRLGTAGVTKGCNPPDNTKFCPENIVRRDQMASFLARALSFTPIVPPPPTSPPVPVNSDVLAIGDSVMQGVACNPDISCYSPSLNLEGEIPDLSSNALVNRQFSEGKTIISDWLAAGNSPDIVVMHLGTNGPATSSQFAEVMNAAQDVPRVLFLTVKQNNTMWETTTNDVIRTNVGLYEAAELVDWYAVATEELDMDSIDPSYGAHLWTTEARQVYIDMIAGAVAGP